MRPLLWENRLPCVGDQRVDILCAEPGLLRVVHPAHEPAQEGGVPGEQGIGQCAQHKRPDALATRDESFKFEFVIRLQDRVGAQEELVHDLFDGRQLVAPLEHAEAQRVLDLLHKLNVGWDPGVALQAELKHLIICSYKLLNMQSYDTYSTAWPMCQGRPGT